MYLVKFSSGFSTKILYAFIMSTMPSNLVNLHVDLKQNLYRFYNKRLIVQKVLRWHKIIPEQDLEILRHFSWYGDY
jgi:hypothetical protein